MLILIWTNIGHAKNKDCEWENDIPCLTIYPKYQNNSNALSYLQVQDGALRTIGNIVDRIAELRTMANDITKNSSDIENYSKEFKELQHELNQISKSQFNGISLFTTDDVIHKEGYLHRVDDGISYNGLNYNKFSRIASTHEDGDYDSGHVSINVVNLSSAILSLS